MDGQIEHVYILGMDEQVARIIIPAGVTILVFVATQFYTWWKGQVGKKKEVVAYREMILKWGELVEPEVHRQIEECREFVRKIEQSETIDPETLNTNNFFVDKVESIGLDRYMNSFVINSTGKPEDNYKYVFDVISRFAYLKTKEKGIAERYGNYRSTIQRVYEKWDLNFDELMVLYKELQSSFSTAYSIKALDIFEAWRTNPIADDPMSRKGFTVPLSRVEADFSKGIESQIFFKNWDVMTSWNEWEGYNRVYIEEFEEEAEKLEAALLSLKVACAYFKEKTRVKSVWRIR